MPDENGKLIDEDARRIEKWMNDHQMSCPGCRTQNLLVADYLVGVPPIMDGKLQTVGQPISVSPLIPITCSQCGFVVHLNAKIVGIV